ncbi:hypothetical protein TWF481_011542 [Arthrobotrys musiformis]|uniref:Uncharacterized protein n=1 Tax=Arthrobotrys musiformis TaxID=47236 RepID=A0AAV9VYM1_9PEZI
MNNSPSQQDRKGKGRAPRTPSPPKRARPTGLIPPSVPGPASRSRPDSELLGVAGPSFRRAKAESGPALTVFKTAETPVDISAAAREEKKAAPQDWETPKREKLNEVLAALKAMAEPSAPSSANPAAAKPGSQGQGFTSVVPNPSVFPDVPEPAAADEQPPSPFLRPPGGAVESASAAAQKPKPERKAVADAAPQQVSGEKDTPVIALQGVSQNVRQQPVFPTAVLATDKDEGDLPDAPPCAILHVAVDREIDMFDAPIDCDDHDDVEMSEAPVLRAYGGHSLPLSRKHVQFLKKMRTFHERIQSDRQRRMTINLWGTGLFPKFSRNFTDPQVKIDRRGVYLVGRSTCKWPKRA